MPELERFTLVCSKQAVHSWPREQLKDIDGLRFLTHLHDLWIEGCWLVRDLRFLQSLPKLRSLQLVSCRALQDLQGIEYAPQLTTVRLDHCQSVVELEPLASLPKLKHLFLAALKGRSLQVRDRLKQLETLDLTGWDDLDDFALFQGDA